MSASPEAGPWRRRLPWILGGCLGLWLLCLIILLVGGGLVYRGFSQYTEGTANTVGDIFGEGYSAPQGYLPVGTDEADEAMLLLINMPEHRQIAAMKKATPQAEIDRLTADDTTAMSEYVREVTARFNSDQAGKPDAVIIDDVHDLELDNGKLTTVAGYKDKSDSGYDPAVLMIVPQKDGSMVTLMMEDIAYEGDSSQPDADLKEIYEQLEGFLAEMVQDSQLDERIP